DYRRVRSQIADYVAMFHLGRDGLATGAGVLQPLGIAAVLRLGSQVELHRPRLAVDDGPVQAGLGVVLHALPAIVTDGHEAGMAFDERMNRLTCRAQRPPHGREVAVEPADLGLHVLRPENGHVPPLQVKMSTSGVSATGRGPPGVTPAA